MVVPILLFSAIALAVLWATLLWLRERMNPKQIGRRLRRFVGLPLDKLEIHEKTYPGYDLASVNLALASFHDERCTSAEAAGALTHPLRALVSSLPTTYAYKEKPTKPTYERMPVDVEREESFISNCLWLVALSPGGEKPGGASPRERLALHLSFNKGAPVYDEDFEVKASKGSSLSLTVACRSRATADLIFNEIEARRKRLSIYRGKVVDPVMDGGGISALGFRRIKPVGEADLVLPESVKSLVMRSVVGFYKHKDTLRGLGVEMKRGVLFHGPPGTGKTSISLYLANHLPHFTVCFVSGQRLMYPRELCRMARYLQPSMLVFEDIDLIAQERDTNGLATVLGELMNQIDGCDPDEQVLFVMNTNSLDRLEQAVRNRPGRVDQIVHIPLPDAGARRQLFRQFAQNLKLADDVVERAVEATDGATPALIKEVVKRAAVNAVERAGDSRSGDAGAVASTGASAGANGDAASAATNPDALTVTEGDLMLAVQQVQLMRHGAAPVGPRIADAIL
jgi:hypothetical protein